MGLVERQKKAIARISVEEAGGEEVGRGTGFLIAKGARISRASAGAPPDLVAPGAPAAAGALAEALDLVLTAAHVVIDRETKNARGSTIKLVFGTDTRTPQEVEAEITKRLDLDRDWVILACTTPVAGEPLARCRRVPDGGGGDWESFGYTKTKAEGGAPYNGRIDDRGAAILYLSASQLSQAQGGDPRGLSGGPCISQGAVVGLIRSAPSGVDAGAPPPDGEVVAYEGRLWATPIEIIAAACPEIDALRAAAAPARRLPYERRFAALLAQIDPGILADIGDMLKLPVEGGAREILAQEVACAMLSGGLEATVRVLEGHGEFFGDKRLLLVQLAETLWARERAIARLASFVEQPGSWKAAAINAMRLGIGDHYVRRASDAKHAGERWTKACFRVLNVIPADGADPGSEGDSLVREVRDVLCRGLPCPTGNDDSLRKRIKQREPVVVLIPEPAPQESRLRSLEKTFPGLRIVLLTADALSAESELTKALVSYIEPAIERTEEHEALEASRDARERLGLPLTENF